MSFAEQLAARAAAKNRSSVSATTAPSIITSSAGGGESDSAGKEVTASSSSSSLEKVAVASPSEVGNSNSSSSSGHEEPATPLIISPPGAYESGSSDDDTDEAGNRSNKKSVSSSKRGGGRSSKGLKSPQSTAISESPNAAAALNDTDNSNQKQRSKNKLIQKGTTTSNSNNSNNNSSINISSGSSGMDYKSKADKYKSENKKLRIESLLLKAKLEKLEIGKHSSDSDSDSDDSDSLTSGGGGGSSPSKKRNLIKENERLKDDMNEWKERCQQLEITLLENEGGNELDKEGKELPSKEELIEENVRLNQLLKEIGGLKELERLQSAKKTDTEDTDNHNASIQSLQQQLTDTKSELAEITELKNAEIDVLRKQLNRAEHKQTSQKVEDEKDKLWNKERESLREEIRRLNLEVSTIKNSKPRDRSSITLEEEEDSHLTSRYKRDSNGGVAPPMLDNADVASLESIIAMMRQTIDQCNKEKDVLEQRLGEEQERSQMELQAFAKTLEGVDDLRKSAETMSREIRRIKVKGYRPTRTELFGTGSSLLEGGRNNFGELSAAVEASESMEEAIRLIESQNDAMEERRRMGVVASRAAQQATTTATTTSTTNKDNSEEYSSWMQKGEIGRYRGKGGGGGGGLRLAPISDDREGGFLSFWNTSGASGSGDGDGDGEDNHNNNNGGEKNSSKEEKKKKSKRREKKKKSSDHGSVLTSFF